MRSFKDLEIWNLGMQVVRYTYSITRTFPEYERFGLSNQMTRAAVSIPSNIAEGFGRMSSKDFSRFLNYALGSLYELETQMIIAVEQNYCTEYDEELVIKLRNKIVAFISKV